MPTALSPPHGSRREERSLRRTRQQPTMMDGHKTGRLLSQPAGRALGARAWKDDGSGLERCVRCVAVDQGPQYPSLVEVDESTHETKRAGPKCDGDEARQYGSGMDTQWSTPYSSMGEKRMRSRIYSHSLGGSLGLYRIPYSIAGQPVGRLLPACQLQSSGRLPVCSHWSAYLVRQRSSSSMLLERKAQVLLFY